MAKFAEGGVVSGGNILWHSDVAETIIPPEKIRNILGLDDIVQVVRCKDCVYAKNNYLVHGLCLCEKQMHHVVHGDRPKNALMCEDDFCSYGERREA